MNALANPLRFDESTLWVDLPPQAALEDSEAALDELAAFLRGLCKDSGIRPFRPVYADCAHRRRWPCGAGAPQEGPPALPKEEPALNPHPHLPERVVPVGYAAKKHG